MKSHRCRSITMTMVPCILAFFVLQLYTVLSLSTLQGIGATKHTSTTDKPKKLFLVEECPSVSPYTGLDNYFWKFQNTTKVRYCTTAVTAAATKRDHKEAQDQHTGYKVPVILLHGLFGNADHFRRALVDEKLKERCDLFAFDLIGWGWSDRPHLRMRTKENMLPPWASKKQDFNSPTDSKYKKRNLAEQRKTLLQAQQRQQQMERICGERRRFGPPDTPAFRTNITLISSNGKAHCVPQVDLRHPLQSLYNIYTWSDQVCAFTEEVVNKVCGVDDCDNKQNKKAILVAHSLGTSVALQCVLDRPDLFSGVLSLNPNFREYHSAQMGRQVAAAHHHHYYDGSDVGNFLGGLMVNFVQRLLPGWFGKALYRLLGNPSAAKTILLWQPYAVKDAVDDDLVEALLMPLLTPGARDVVFDTLSYTAGPLPEQQLVEIRNKEKTKHSQSSNKGLTTKERMCSTTIAPIRIESDNNDNNSKVEERRNNGHQAQSILIWFGYGALDPWTPSERVEALGPQGVLPLVDEIITFDKAGHCPHDETPNEFQNVLLKIVDKCRSRT